MADQGSGCLKNASVGCAVILLLAVAFGVGGYFVVANVTGEVQAASQLEAARQVSPALENMELSEEQRELIEELLEYSQRANLGYHASMVSSCTLLSVIADRTIDEEELAHLSLVTAFFADNPNPGWIEVGSWLAEHPEFREYIKRLKQSMGRGGAVHFEPTEPAETTEAAPEEDAPAPEEVGAPPEVQQ